MIRVLLTCIVLFTVGCEPVKKKEEEVGQCVSYGVSAVKVVKVPTEYGLVVIETVDIGEGVVTICYIDSTTRTNKTRYAVYPGYYPKSK